MIARLATQMRERAATGDGGAGAPANLILGEGGMVVLDDNCVVSIFFTATSIQDSAWMLTVFV